MIAKMEDVYQLTAVFVTIDPVEMVRGVNDLRKWVV